MTPLQDYAGPLLRAYPELRPRWNDAGDELHLRKTDAQGYDIRVSMDKHTLYLFVEHGYDDHWRHHDPQALQGNLDLVFGLVRDLLSPKMRLRALLSNGLAFRWLLERRERDCWECESSVGLLFWSYFGRRSEAIYVNRVLPARGFPEDTKRSAKHGDSDA